MIKKIFKIISILSFCQVTYAQEKIDIYFYSDYMGPEISVLFETNEANTEYKEFIIKSGISENLRDYIEGKNSKCSDLQRLYERKKTGGYGVIFDKIYKVSFSRSSDFQVKYKAQENGPSKGTWIGDFSSKPGGCFILNFNQRKGSLNNYGRFLFTQGSVTCAGKYEYFVNDEPVGGKLSCYQYPIYEGTKGLCDGFNTNVPFLSSKLYQYGEYKIKEVFHIDNPKSIRVREFTVKINEPCEWISNGTIKRD